MRNTETGGWRATSSSRALTQALRLSAVVLGIGLLMAPSIVRAADDDEDDKSFEEKIIDNIMSGIGGTNMESKGIDYRERSPLVVPPKLDLPPPVSAKSQVNDPNWPKDPDVAHRKAASKAREKPKPTPWEAARPLTPAELDVGKTAPSTHASNDPLTPGVTNNPALSPSQLGFDGKLGHLFGGGNKSESVPFTAEPPRQSLVEPPPGYQTPSPDHPYGTGPKENLTTHFDVMKGKDVPN